MVCISSSRPKSFRSNKSVLWEFVSVPQNLNEITPPEMAFQIVGDLPDRAKPGLLLEYRVKIPFLVGLPG